MLTYNGNLIGSMVIEQNTANGKKNRYNIQIRQGNCLCVFIHVRKATKEELAENPNGKYIHTLNNFFADEAHIKNIIKNQDKLFFDKICKIELNMYFKEAKTLLKYLTKQGYKVTCYYKETNKATDWEWQK